MTLIDKAEALLPCPFCGGVAEQDYQQPYRSLIAGKIGKACTIYCTECSANVILCHEDHHGVSPDDLMAELVAAWNRSAALPARGVGVRCLVWEDFDGLGAKASAFYQANYLIQWWKGEGRYEVALSYPGYQTGYDGVRWHDTLEAAKAAAQADYEARILSAPSPPRTPHMLTKRRKANMTARTC